MKISETLKLSVIIPCHNAFSKMKKALSCFEMWDKNLFEVIIVDDCSTDYSYEHLLDYAQSINYQIIIKKNDINIGAGPTRNNGIKMAKGEYLVFLDADDFFADNFLQEVLPYLNGENDCVIFDYVKIEDGEKKKNCPMFFCDFIEGKLNKKDVIVYINGSTMGKIYKRQIVIENNICFLSLKVNEDMPFVKCAVSKCDEFYYIKQPLYCYIQYADSLMHKSSFDLNDNSLTAFDKVEEVLGTKYCYELEAIFALECVYDMGVYYGSLLKRKQWKEKIRKIESKYPNYSRNRYVRRYSIVIRMIIFLISIKNYAFIRLVSKIKYNLM